MTRRLFLASVAAVLPLKACAPQDTRPVPVPAHPGPPPTHSIQFIDFDGKEMAVYGTSGHDGAYRVTSVKPGRISFDRSRVPVGRL